MADFEHGLSSIDMQNINRISIINFIYNSSGVTQQMIAKRLNISMPTVIQNIKELREKNLLVEESTLDSSGGRRPRLIEFNYNSHYSVGVMVKSHEWAVVLLNLKGEIKDSVIHHEKFKHTGKYWKSINASISDILAANGIDRELIIGVGISLPCVVIHSENRLDMSTTLPALNYTPFAEIQRHFDFPVYFENEANAAGYAEAWVRRKYNDVVYLSINEGISGAIITSRGISHGNNGRLGEFGHAVIHTYGKPCICGRKGCFEVYCSTKVLSETTNDSLEAFWCKLKSNDKEAVQLFDEYLRDLAIMITNIRVALDCDIIIGGDIKQGLDRNYSRLIQLVDAENKYFENHDYLSLAYYDDIGAAVGVAELRNIDFVNR